MAVIRLMSEGDYSIDRLKRILLSEVANYFSPNKNTAEDSTLVGSHFVSHKNY